MQITFLSIPLLLYTVRIHAVQYNVIDSVSLSRNSICQWRG